jgi:mono/diheme cytochrome c family protein
MIATNVVASAQEVDKGRIEFLSKCAECHGTDGKGAGPMSSRLKNKPPDLTVVAKRNNGVFPADAVAKAVDGRGESHRGTEMPIWGCRQGPPPDRKRGYEPKPIDSLLDIPCDAEQVIRSRILDVVEYLGRIQEK